MNIAGFGAYFSVLGHCVRIHMEANSFYNWFDWRFEYDESLNGCRLIIEFLKIQVFIGIGSNVQDVWFFDSSSYFLQQEHDRIPKELQELLESNNIVTDEDEILE